MTCAGAVAVMHKLGRLPVIARLGLMMGVIEESDIEASAAVVIDPATLELSMAESGGPSSRRARVGAAGAGEEGDDDY